jgi:hypothetical protein
MYGAIQFVRLSFCQYSCFSYLYFKLKYLNKVFPRGEGFRNSFLVSLLCGFSCYYFVNGCFQSSYLDLKCTVSAYNFMVFSFIIST